MGLRAQNGQANKAVSKASFEGSCSAVRVCSGVEVRGVRSGFGLSTSDSEAATTSTIPQLSGSTRNTELAHAWKCHRFGACENEVSCRSVAFLRGFGVQPNAGQCQEDLVGGG